MEHTIKYKKDIWEEAERQADEDIKAGNISKVFKTPEEGIEHLNRLTAPDCEGSRPL